MLVLDNSPNESTWESDIAERHTSVALAAERHASVAVAG
jgi:hypothetical protein